MESKIKDSPTNVCPECNGLIISIDNTGDVLCSACGLVLNEKIVADFDGNGVLNNQAHKDHNIDKSGHIASQLHSGDELKIQFKNIKIRNI